MKNRLWLIVFILFVGALGVHADEIDDNAQGWTPAMNAHWTEVQMDYARALHQYGAGSPEATQAEVVMNTLARDLGIKPSGAVPEVAPEDTVVNPSTPTVTDKQEATNTREVWDPPAVEPSNPVVIP